MKIDLTKDQIKDAGLIIVLGLLYTGLVTENRLFFILSMISVFLIIVFPLLFKWFAFLWFGLAHILGTYFSKIILSIVFYTVVTPVGVIRRWLGKDEMKLREFKDQDKSAWISREKLFSSEDIKKPF